MSSISRLSRRTGRPYTRERQTAIGTNPITRVMVKSTIIQLNKQGASRWTVQGFCMFLWFYERKKNIGSSLQPYVLY